MKPTLALLVYVMTVGSAQVETLPTTLPPTPGLKVPVAASNPAGLAAPAGEPQDEGKPRATAEEPPQVTPPLVVAVPGPNRPNPAGLAAPAAEPKAPARLIDQPLPQPAVLPPLPPLVPPDAAEASPPMPTPVPVVPSPPTPWPGPAASATRPTMIAPPWQRLRPALRPAGPAAGYFVVQDVHGAWPTVAAGLPAPTAAPPLAAAAPPPVVRASSHPLPPAATVLPVIYTTRSGPTKAEPAKTDPPAAAPEKMVIVQAKQPKEIVWGAQDEYRKIVGQLVRVHVHGGRWVVRYAGLDKEDRYGGSVVLDPESDLGRLTEGDIVCVQGQILNGGRAERPLGAPLYRVQSLQRLGGGKN